MGILQTVNFSIFLRKVESKHYHAERGKRLLFLDLLDCLKDSKYSFSFFFFNIETYIFVNKENISAIFFNHKMKKLLLVHMTTL